MGDEEHGRGEPERRVRSSSGRDGESEEQEQTRGSGGEEEHEDEGQSAPRGDQARADHGDQAPAEQGEVSEGEGVPERRVGPACAVSSPFPVVGLGASAGGLEALKRFFAHVDPGSGVGFVVVLHQQPGHESLIPELLGRQTTMPVVEATSGTRVERGHVYVAPPGTLLTISDRTLELSEATGGSRRLPIDHFLRSLALDQQEQAIAVILSGTGTDGTLGLQEIKGASGMVMVQEERSAQYAGMPQSAIATQLVDYVLPVEELPAQLEAYARAPACQGSPPGHSPEVLRQVFVLLRSRLGHDFSHYKPTTIGRRIDRRLSIHGLESGADYLEFLRSRPEELDALFNELLIGVTSFFRDPLAFERLEESLQQLLSELPEEEVVRVWVPGCSTGEEAYSLAILYQELGERLQCDQRIQIFATDLNPKAVEVARSGVYPSGIAADMSSERLERFFSPVEGGFVVRKELRELLVFATQNVIADPPFTKLHLISCRNVLIYMDATLQKRLFPVFHYALRSQGLLFLGSSESIIDGPLFATLDKRSKVFRRCDAGTAEPPSLPLELQRSGRSGSSLLGARGGRSREFDRLLLNQLVPPSVIVRERGEVVHIHGRTGRLLEPAPGSQASANIYSMAREGLQIQLTIALREAATGPHDVVTRRAVHVKENGGYVQVDLRVQRLTAPEDFLGLFLISFLLVPNAAGEVPLASEGIAEPERVLELERELRNAKESQRGTFEELLTTNEELQTTNEEFQSTNEELQSANEELETSKEELQSLNEELQTVNGELQGKIEELSRANDDMKNLLDGTKIAMVFLDNDLRIRRFTAQARQVIRLISSDLGRPIGDIVTRFQHDSLETDAREVLRSLTTKEVEVRGAQADYLIRILPYRTAENLIDGLVITFIDVTRLTMRDREPVGSPREPPSAAFLTGQDCTLRYTWVGGAAFGPFEASCVGQTDAELFPAEQARRLTDLKQGVLESGEPSSTQLVLSERDGGQQVELLVTAARDAEGTVGVTCVYTTPLADDRGGR